MSEEATVIEGEAVEVEREGEVATQALAAPAPRLAVAPQVKAGDLVERLSAIREAQHKAMVVDVDYGLVPGTDKPTLFKPGAEKLSVLFQLDVQLENEKQWGPDEHLTVISHATVFHAPTGSRLGYGEGICTTRERKYAKRKQERTCPSCGKASVIKGKAEYGGGWLCWKKRDGCGAKFAEGAQEIESQDVGEIDNPDLPDLWNTVVKMAEKRARVDAVLAVTGASALFTQDVEDQAAPVPDQSAASPSEVERDRASHVSQRDNARMGFASDKQRNFFERLLREAGGKPETIAAITGYAVEGLTTQQVSAAIDDLKARGAEAAKQLAEQANDWLSKQSDVPADTEGLEPAVEPDEEVGA